MRHLSCFLGFNLLILTSQTVQLLVVGQASLLSISPDYVVAQGYSSEDSSVDDNSSPSRGSDRRDS